MDPQPGCQASSEWFPGARDTLTEENPLPTVFSTPHQPPAAAMDVSYCSAAAPLPEIHSQLPFDYEALMGPGCWAPPPEACDQASDSGYFSASGSSLSPTSSVDSFSFSPAYLSAAAAAATTTTAAAAAAAAAGPEPDDLDCLLSSLNRLTGAPPPPAAAAAAAAAAVSSCSARTQQSGSSSPAKAPAGSAAASTTTTTTRRSWSRFPGRKRQTASEREKMRMRDLTKSLNYLRSFLPASVAPAGRTLTKIETLRLTMRYIAHLSAQLGHAGPESAPEAGGAAAAAPPTQQNLPAFQPMVEQPRNGSYVPEEPLLHHHHHNHHYRHVVMDTVSHQQNQAAEQQVPPQNHYQGSGSFGSPLFNGQYWTSADLLQQNMFSS
ncbi:unnamed protein product [Arctogadus glacialis]